MCLCVCCGRVCADPRSFVFLGGTYNLVVPGTGRAPPPPPPEAGGEMDPRAQLQLEITARLLAKGAVSYI